MGLLQFRGYRFPGDGLCEGKQAFDGGRQRTSDGIDEEVLLFDADIEGDVPGHCNGSITRTLQTGYSGSCPGSSKGLPASRLLPQEALPYPCAVVAPGHTRESAPRPELFSIDARLRPRRHPT